MSELKLYQLTGKDDLLISPFCIRAKLALAHVGATYQEVFVKMSEKEHKIPFKGHSQLPILVDGERVISGTWEIVNYLERNFVDSPTLLGGQFGASHAKFINSWVDSILDLEILILVIKDLHGNLDKNCQKIFRESREIIFGRTLEDIQNDRDELVLGFRNSLVPLRITLKEQAFFSGNVSAYADYLIYSSFLWAETISDFPLLEEGDPLLFWKKAMDETYLNLQNKKNMFNAS